MENTYLSPSQIFGQFSREDWFNWIDDILKFGFAYPSLGSEKEAEQLIQIVDFLKVSKINSRNYEDAIISMVDYYYGTRYVPSLEQVVNVMIVSGSLRFKSKILGLYLDPILDTCYGSKDYLKSKLLLGLSRLSLEEAEKKMVKEYVQLSGLARFDYNLSFIGHYLSFIIAHYPPLFFEKLTKLCEVLPYEIKDTKYQIGIQSVIYSKLNEYHFSRRVNFYSNVMLWLNDTFQLMDKISTYDATIRMLYKLFQTSRAIRDEIIVEDSEEAIYGKNLNQLLKFIFARDSSSIPTVTDFYRFMQFFHERNWLSILKMTLLRKNLNGVLRSNYTVYSNFFSQNSTHPLYNTPHTESVIVEERAIEFLLDKVFLSPVVNDNESPEEGETISCQKEKEELLTLFWINP